jgi:hypothetical protein
MGVVELAMVMYFACEVAIVLLRGLENNLGSVVLSLLSSIPRIAHTLDPFVSLCVAK